MVCWLVIGTVVRWVAGLDYLPCRELLYLWLMGVKETALLMVVLLFCQIPPVKIISIYTIPFTHLAPPV